MPGASGTTGASDGWFRREAAAAVPRQRDDDQDVDRFPGNQDTARFPGAQDTARFPEGPSTDRFQGTQDTARFSESSAGAGYAPAAAQDTGSAVGHDSWQESEHPEHTHDPHEVTVQLDGVGRQLEDWLVQQAKGAPSTQEGSDGPVFVDETGRRSRMYRRIGMAVGLACAVYAVAILITLISGNSNAPWLPIKDQQEDSPAGQVEPSPQPTDSAVPSGSASASPEASVSGTEGTTPSPGASLSADTSASAKAPDTSADPKPSASTTKPGTGTNNSPDPGDDPTDEVPASPDPEPEPTDTGVTDGPTTEAPAGGDTNDVADAPLTAEPTPIEPSPPTPSSPENIL
ncbi:hypothetical protein MUK60_25955 [Streptomyces sp. LRE541]|uniref:hypothetical protein n=1 Tax=Streptomyces sp. LRE541 TaxID=2931983 RepID=UPI0020106604|nr:hypothetical protein [Streptomyces sp. LRE541]UPZ30913.1 hypothetical protein MUK60_25955 [Streptomyces sp. LRE541]